MSADDFLKDLQMECLNDPEKRFAALRQAAEGLANQPGDSLVSILKICREMRSNLEPCGFTFLASLVSEFETQISAIEQAYRALGGQHQADDAFVLQFFLGDVFQNFEGYFETLKADLTDSAARADERRPSVNILSSWRPTAAAAAPVQANAASVASAPVHAKPELKIVPPAEVEPSINEEIGLAQRHQYLICRSSVPTGEKSGFRTFAIPIRQIIEVIDHQTVNLLPYPKEGIAGILNFRGDPLPVLVCNDRGELQDRAAREFVVIARIDDKMFGFQMEQVVSVADLDPASFQTPDQWLAPHSGTWVTHLVKTENEVTLVMNLEKALAA